MLGLASFVFGAMGIQLEHTCSIHLWVRHHLRRLIHAYSSWRSTRHGPGYVPCRYGLNEPAVAEHLEKAVDAVLDAGYRTGDIAAEGCKQVTCSEMGNALADAMSQ